MKGKESYINEISAENKTAYIGKLERLKDENMTQTTNVKTLQDEVNSQNQALSDLEEKMQTSASIC